MAEGSQFSTSTVLGVFRTHIAAAENLAGAERTQKTETQNYKIHEHRILFNLEEHKKEVRAPIRGESCVHVRNRCPPSTWSKINIIGRVCFPEII